MTIAVPAHVNVVINDLAVGQENLCIAPAAAPVWAIPITRIDHAAHTTMRVVPVIGVIGVKRIIAGIVILAAITIREACANTRADQ